ncbi:MAG: hypothetical protein ACD_50C00286G0005, partial [uncultured bacterium]
MDIVHDAGVVKRYIVRLALLAQDKHAQCSGGGMVDALASEASVRKNMGVRLSPRAQRFVHPERSRRDSSL